MTEATPHMLARHRSPTRAGHFRFFVALAAVWVLGTVGLSISGLLPEKTAQIVDNFGQFGAGLAAATCFWWTWHKAKGNSTERRWRFLFACGVTGWTCGQIVWSWYQIVLDQGLPSPSLADVGYLSLPLFALPALLCLPADPVLARPPLSEKRQGNTLQRHNRILLLLDATVVVGSLFLLSWATALGSVLESGAASPGAFIVAMAYAITDILMVVVVTLTGIFRRPRRPASLFLLGAGVIALSVSDSFFLYVLSSGAVEMPPLYNVGFVAGPALLGLSALIMDTERATTTASNQSDSVGNVTGNSPSPITYGLTHFTHAPSLIATYLPLTGVGGLTFVQLAFDLPIGNVQIFMLLLLVTTVVVRQLLSLRENNHLLQVIRTGHEQLREQAFHDPLTSLANRALFQHRLEEAVQQHRAIGYSFCLLYIDLDDFKTINDTLGHSTGDGFLVRIGDQLRRCVRSTDTVARLGGDEFAVVLDGHVPDISLLGKKILNAIERAGGPTITNQLGDAATASVGIVVVPSWAPSTTSSGDLSAATSSAQHYEQVTADLLLQHADTAMYAAKRAGKGTFVTYEPDHDIDVTDDNQLSSWARWWSGHPAPNRLKIQVRYAPVVQLENQKLVAVQAITSDSEFALGRPVEDAILDAVSHDIPRLRMGYPQLAVHVDVPMTRLLEPDDLLAHLRNAVRWRGIPADSLVIEITPTRAVTDLVRIGEVLATIRQLGIRVALCGFGTGVSNLDQVLTLPIDIIELARGLLSGDLDSHRAESIAATAVHLGRTLDVPLCAPGIDNRRQANILKEAGCDLGQGKLFGEPQTCAEMMASVDPVHHLNRRLRQVTDLTVVSENSSAING
ncbi:MAG: putative bifunctional diguanylate cyclase/phosphodiesterase [Actinomycetota bacterium]